MVKGEKTLNQITRWLTIAVCLVQAPSYLGSITGLFLPYTQFSSAYYIDPNSIMFWLPSIVILVTGSVFAMWLGEKLLIKESVMVSLFLLWWGSLQTFLWLSFTSFRLRLVKVV